METLAILESHQPFERFLESYTSNEVVGIAIDMAHCPLALFVRTHGYPEASISCWFVFPEGVGLAPGSPCLNLPMWAKNFVAIVDHKRRRGTPSAWGFTFGPTEITALVALNVLRTAVECGDVPWEFQEPEMPLGITQASFDLFPEGWMEKLYVQLAHAPKELVIA